MIKRHPRLVGAIRDQGSESEGLKAPAPPEDGFEKSIDESGLVV